MFEDGDWYFLHEQVCPDIMGSLDSSNDQKLQILGPLHAQYSTLQTIQNTVPTPKPYASIDNDNTYTESKTNFGRNK